VSGGNETSTARRGGGNRPGFSRCTEKNSLARAQSIHTRAVRDGISSVNRARGDKDFIARLHPFHRRSLSRMSAFAASCARRTKRKTNFIFALTANLQRT
jgi:hypothetical protein